jgi:hypothetical protein
MLNTAFYAIVLILWQILSKSRPVCNTHKKAKNVKEKARNGK